MDIMMPRVSGLDVLRFIRDTPGLSDVPVVLMSVIPPAARQSDYRWQAFLHKPFTLQSVLHAVREHVGEPAAAPK
jgi:CheY-like chemotaxis protein